MSNTYILNNGIKCGVRRLINTGAEIAGGAVGGALGFLAGGPIGAALLGAGGAAAAVVLKSIGEEASERFLGPREQVRVGGVLAIVAEEIRQRLEKGESIRADGFFDPKGVSRSDAEEVAESVLMKSQREPEEKKIPFMGYLFAAVAFDPNVSAQMAHQILKTTEQLTYRQLCLLKLAVGKSEFALRNHDYRNYDGDIAKELYQVLYECLDLSHRALIHFGGEVVFGPTDVKPGRMTIQGLGVDIFTLMKLELIPDEELVPIAKQLK
jgi:hypothetical protein